MTDFNNTKWPLVDKCLLFHDDSLFLIRSIKGYQNCKRRESPLIGRSKYTKGKLPVLQLKIDATSTNQEFDTFNTTIILLSKFTFSPKRSSNKISTVFIAIHLSNLFPSKSLSTTKCKWICWQPHCNHKITMRPQSWCVFITLNNSLIVFTFFSE